MFVQLIRKNYIVGFTRYVVNQVDQRLPQALMLINHALTIFIISDDFVHSSVRCEIELFGNSKKFYVIEQMRAWWKNRAQPWEQPENCVIMVSFGQY